MDGGTGQGSDQSPGADRRFFCLKIYKMHKNTLVVCAIRMVMYITYLHDNARVV